MSFSVDISSIFSSAQLIWNVMAPMMKTNDKRGKKEQLFFWDTKQSI